MAFQNYHLHEGGISFRSIWTVRLDSAAAVDRAIVQKQNGLGAIRALHPGGDFRKAGSHFLEHGGTVYRVERI